MELQPDLSYYENPRADILPYIKGKFVRSLDVGCGAGAVSAALRRSGIVARAEGVELFPEAAKQAEAALDGVYRVDLSHSREGIPAGYDLVLCLDVLEHMQDPWAALARIRELMNPGGTLVVSLPNVRNFRVVLPLLLRGRWAYTESGLLDITHLRFFTRQTARALVEGAGFTVKECLAPNMGRWGKARILNLLSLGLFAEFLDLQYLLIAER